jgi:hypothetical protein
MSMWVLTLMIRVTDLMGPTELNAYGYRFDTCRFDIYTM